jgi:hypothetical protein
VRALDPVHVAVLERGQHTLPHITERAEQLSPEAQLLTPLQGSADLAGGAEPAAAGLADPPERLIERGRALGQVGDRLLDPRPRGQQDGMTRQRDPGRAMHDQRGHVPVCPGPPFMPGGPGSRGRTGPAAHLAFRGDGHMDSPGRSPAQPVQLGRGLMADRRIPPRREQARPDEGRAGWLAAEGRVDPGGESLPAAITQPDPDRVLADAALQSLPARYHPVLEVE